VRTIIDLPNEQLAELARICRRDGLSRAEVIRRAVDAHLSRDRSSRRDEAFGLWRNRRGDALTLERRLRREWDRDV
jgi:metal-responsive CopG/Arc/MetJ family transcriptional regulator